MRSCLPLIKLFFHFLTKSVTFHHFKFMMRISYQFGNQEIRNSAILSSDFSGIQRPDSLDNINLMRLWRLNKMRSDNVSSLISNKLLCFHVLIWVKPKVQKYSMTISRKLLLAAFTMLLNYLFQECAVHLGDHWVLVLRQ